MQQFEETKYLIDTDKNSEQIELDREEEKEVNSENKEIWPPVDPCSHISPVIEIKSSTFIAKQQKNELAPIHSKVFSKTDVDTCLRKAIINLLQLGASPLNIQTSFWCWIKHRNL
ncbi:hypothetical protein TNCV_3403991 [Trichonephila clavipes]|nr:hypothetical protein TNCV_3403991 [Trichonephila clavipes]